MMMMMMMMNLDDEHKQQLKIEDSKRKEAKRASLIVDEKEQMRIYEKIVKKAMRDNLDGKQKKN